MLAFCAFIFLTWNPFPGQWAFWGRQCGCLPSRRSVSWMSERKGGKGPLWAVLERPAASAEEHCPPKGHSSLEFLLTLKGDVCRFWFSHFQVNSGPCQLNKGDKFLSPQNIWCCYLKKSPEVSGIKNGVNHADLLKAPPCPLHCPHPKGHYTNVFLDGLCYIYISL